MALIIPSLPAAAEGDTNGLLNRLIELPGETAAPPPPVAKAKEHGALRLTSDKNVLVRLEQNAASVIVNNPEHAAIMLDSPRLLIVMPRQPGATSFTVLNDGGDIILQKDIIVTNAQPQYVRIRRMCGSGDSSCLPTAYYYCPDGCYEVTPIAPGSTGTVPPPPARAAAVDAANSAAGLGPAAPPPGESK